MISLEAQSLLEQEASANPPRPATQFAQMILDVEKEAENGWTV